MSEFQQDTLKKFEREVSNLKTEISEEEQLAQEWAALAYEGEATSSETELCESTRVMEQDEIDHLLGFDKDAQETVVPSLGDKLRIKIKVVIGETNLTLKELLQMTRGCVIDLDTKSNTLCDVYVQNKLLAKGKLLPNGDSLSILLTDVL